MGSGNLPITTICELNLGFKLDFLKVRLRNTEIVGERAEGGRGRADGANSKQRRFGVSPNRNSKACFNALGLYPSTGEQLVVWRF